MKVKCFWCKGSGRGNGVYHGSPQVGKGSPVFVRDSAGEWVQGQVTKVIPDSARRLLANHWPFEVLLENGKTVHCAEGQPKALHPCRYCQGEGKRDMDRFDSWLKNRPLTINGTDYYAHFNGQRYYVRRARGARSLRSAAVGIGGALYAMENHRHEENAGPQVVSFTLRDPEEKSPWDCDVCGYPRRERSCPACA